MTPHGHAVRVVGCYRCELGADEAMSALTDERDALTAEVTAMRAVVEAARLMLDTMHPQGYAQSGPRRSLATALAALDSPRSPPEPTERNEG